MLTEYLIKISGEHTELAKNEAEVCMNSQASTLHDTLVLIQSTHLCKNLAFSKSAHLVLFSHPLNTWETQLLQDKAPPIRTVSVVIEQEESILDKKQVLHTIMNWLGNPSVDLHHAQTNIRVFLTSDTVYITQDVWQNTQEFSKRKNQYLPEPHPTAMHPKLARGLVNISGAQTEVLDPFCGSGGILIEAGLLSLRVRGVDIDPIMTRRALINLHHFKIPADIAEGDALRYKKKAECIVTDLPYGKNSKAGELSTLYEKFLDHACELTTKMIVCFPSLVDHKKIVEQSDWKLEHHYEWPLHRSLSKHIYVLTCQQAQHKS